MARHSSSGVLERPADLPEATWPVPVSGAGRVLIIDDHPLVLDLVSHLLRHADYLVERADGGVEGLRHLRQAPPDLVLTDLDMPGASGWDVARAAKALQPPVPVILMTGSGKAVLEDNPECQALVDAILPKPFGVRELLDAVRDLIGKGRDVDATVNCRQRQASSIGEDFRASLGFS